MGQSYESHVRLITSRIHNLFEQKFKIGRGGKGREGIPGQCSRRSRAPRERRPPQQPCSRPSRLRTGKHNAGALAPAIPGMAGREGGQPPEASGASLAEGASWVGSGVQEAGGGVAPATLPASGQWLGEGVDYHTGATRSSGGADVSPDRLAGGSSEVMRSLVNPAPHAVAPDYLVNLVAEASLSPAPCQIAGTKSCPAQATHPEHSRALTRRRGGRWGRRRRSYTT